MMFCPKCGKKIEFDVEMSDSMTVIYCFGCEEPFEIFEGEEVFERYKDELSGLMESD